MFIVVDLGDYLLYFVQQGLLDQHSVVSFCHNLNQSHIDWCL